jgi:hypothetical protein
MGSDTNLTRNPKKNSVGAFSCWDTVDRIGKEVRPRLTPGLCGGPRG